MRVSSPRWYISCQLLISSPILLQIADVPTLIPGARQRATAAPVCVIAFPTGAAAVLGMLKSPSDPIEYLKEPNQKDSRCPVELFSFNISSLVPPLTTSISCPLVPEKDPTTASETAVAGCSVRLSKCIVCEGPRISSSSGWLVSGGACDFSREQWRVPIGAIRNS